MDCDVAQRTPLNRARSAPSALTPSAQNARSECAPNRDGDERRTAHRRALERKISRLLICA